MKKVTGLGLLFYLYCFSSAAVVGGVNDPSIVPSQLCEMTPLSKEGQALADLSCSAIVTDSNKLKTAGHCGFDYLTQGYSQMLLRCYEGTPRVVEISRDNWSFADPMGPLNPRLRVTNSSRVGLDVATVSVVDPLPSAPAKQYHGQLADFLQLAKQCYFVGTGRDQFGQWGYPQGKMIDKSDIIVQPDSTLVVNGPPHVSAHDSGGALFCDQQYVATIVSQMGQDSILSLRDGAPLSSGLPVCPGSQVSAAVKSSVSHFMGFTEVRDFIAKNKTQGLSACFSGLTLNKNSSQYFKNLIFLKFTDDKGKIIKQTSLWYQSSSIQGHHSPSGRPWIVIESRALNEGVLEGLLGSPLNNDINSLIVGFDMSRVLGMFPGEKLEESVMHLDTNAQGDQTYLVTWLKNNSSDQANIYASKLIPKYAVLRLSLNGRVEILKQGGAFNPILVPADDLLKASSLEAQKYNDDIQIYLEKLSEI